jgi:hypothetical protein
MNTNNMCVWIDVLSQLVQLVFIYIYTYSPVPLVKFPYTLTSNILGPKKTRTPT